MVMRKDDVDDARRAFLLSLLSVGAYMLGQPQKSLAGLLGRVPVPLPADRSVYAVEGDVRTNGEPVNAATIIRASDLVETGVNSKVIFVVGKDAFLLRDNSKLQMLAAGAEQLVVHSLRLVSGRLLSVFGASEHRIQTSTATIGIRGTGVYVEAEPEQSYICTCYGTTEVTALDDPNAREVVTSQHHDAPRYVLASDRGGGRIQRAPFKNHTDEELQLIESLVGREPPFELPGDAYATPRRSNY